MSNCLRFFSPAQSSWNLAHILRLLPESHALFVSPEGCSRIIMLSAVAAGMQGRFSTLNVTEENVIAGGMEETIIQAAGRALERFRPRALFIVTSCIADFVGLDRNVFFERLRALYPEVAFLDARMDPINRKSGMPPIVRMHTLLASLFRKESDARAVNVLGSFTPPEEGQELFEYLKSHGFEIRHAYRCQSFDEFCAMGNSRLNLVMHPSAVPAARALQERLAMPWVDLCSVRDEGTLGDAYREICAALGVPNLNLIDEKKRCADALIQLREALQERPLRLDDGYVRSSALLVEALVENGIPVEHLFASGLSEETVKKLESHGVRVTGSDEITCAFDADRYANPEAVCAGDYAAWASGSRHYALGLTFSSRFGVHGLTRTALDLIDACRRERALEEIRYCGAGCFGL